MKKIVMINFEGFFLLRKMSVLWFIYDIVDDIVQKMLDMMGELIKDFVYFCFLCFGLCKEFRCDGEGSFGM